MNDPAAARTPVTSEAVYVISVAAELTGLHPQTLRIYERKGLLDPARTSGGSRRYSARDIERLRRIQALTQLGLTLDAVHHVLDLQDEVERLRGEVQRLQVWASEAVADAQRSTRRDLVPLRQAVEPYGWRPPNFEKEH